MFSEKFGYKLVKEIQHESISDALRVRIWNLFYLSEIQAGGFSSPRISQALSGKPAIEAVIADKLGFNVSFTKERSILEQVEYYLIHDSHWFEVYDLIKIRSRFLTILLEVLKCRYSLYLQALAAFFVMGDVLKSPRISLCFCGER